MIVRLAPAWVVLTRARLRPSVRAEDRERNEVDTDRRCLEERTGRASIPASQYSTPETLVDARSYLHIQLSVRQGVKRTWRCQPVVSTRSHANVSPCGC